jgi:hypothetical protein
MTDQIVVRASLYHTVDVPLYHYAEAMQSIMSDNNFWIVGIKYFNRDDIIGTHQCRLFKRHADATETKKFL